jgi:class 3 adenylate cyclase
LAVNLAARVCGQAEAGEIVISEATYHEAEEVTTDFKSLGLRPLKGVEEPVGLYRLGG